MSEDGAVSTERSAAVGTSNKGCSICGEPFPNNGLICKECKNIRKIPRLSYFASVFAAPLVVPVALLITSFIISSKIEAAKQAGENIQKFTSELKERMNLAVEFDARIREVQRPCAATEADPQKRQAVCISRYLEALNGLDSAVIKLSWMIGLLPIDGKARTAGKSLRDDYWHSCSGTEACRESINNELWQLRWCPMDIFSDQACKKAFLTLQRAAMTLNYRMEEVFCHLRIDVNLLSITSQGLDNRILGVADDTKADPDNDRASCAAERKRHEEATRAAPVDEGGP